MGLYTHIALVFANINVVATFFPNHLTNIDLGKGTWTHEDITEEGILRAVANFFEENPRPGSTITKGELTGMDEISAHKLFVKYYGAKASEKRFQEAVDRIVTISNEVHRKYGDGAIWNFNAETMTEGHDIMINVRKFIIDKCKAKKPRFDVAIYWIGEYLHIMQMFYSNTNWVEISGDVPYYSLVFRSSWNIFTSVCWDSDHSSCTDNLIMGGRLLTSGYKSGQDTKKPDKDPKKYQTGKCSHGGTFDKTSRTIAALGGINKDANSTKLSPHHHLHAAAAKAAITHTVYFFEDKDHGLRNIIGNTNYRKLLQLKAGNSMALVLDYSGSMSDDIDAVRSQITDIIHNVTGTLNEPSSYIVSLFNDPRKNTKVFQFDSGEHVLAYLKNVAVESNFDCPEYVMDGIEKALTLCPPETVMYVFTDASAKDPERAGFIEKLALQKRVKITFLLTGSGDRFASPLRPKRSTNGYDLFKSLSESTGGSVYVTSKAEISNVADLIKESALGSTVTILKRTIPAGSLFNVTFPVDTTVRHITIQISTAEGSPSEKVISPNGSSGIKNMTIRDIGSGIKLIKIELPVYGNWRISRLDSNAWNMVISAQSSLNIFTKFVQKHPRTGFEYEIIGRPIAGSSATLIAKLPSLEMASSLDNVFLLDSMGSEFIQHGGFTTVEARERSDIFRRHFQLPENSFQVALSGMDNKGNKFLRLVAENIVPVHIQLEILPVKGNLYVGERLSVPVEVTNKGDTPTSITVSLKDDKGLAQSPVEYTLPTNVSETKFVEFWLQAGPREGITTTVIVSAKTSSTDHDNFQYVVQYFTTTKRIIRERDNKDPVCKIVNVTGTCDVTVLDPCLCSQHQWFAAAEVGDDGVGLFQVSSSIASDGKFSVDNFTMGHTIMNGTVQCNLSASCCDAVAYINVVDTAGNVGQCFLNVISDDGRAVTNASIVDVVKSMKQCQRNKTKSKEQNVTPTGVIWISLGVTAFIVILIVTIVVIVKKRKGQRNVGQRVNK